MKSAIIAYDLKHVNDDDNQRVKEALLKYSDTMSLLQGMNALSYFPQWVTLSLPDTTVLVAANNISVSSKDLTAVVVDIIRSVGAVPDKVFVAFIEDDFLWNNATDS